MRNGFVLSITSLILVLIVQTVSFAQVNDKAQMLQSSRSATGTRVAWQKAQTFTFDDPKQMDSFAVAAGKFEIKDGTLRAIEGNTNRAIMIAKNNFGNYFRIEMEVTNYVNEETGRTGDITFLINSVPVEKYEVFFFNGYGLTTASFGNSNTAFYKKGKPFARTEYTPVFSGKKNIATLDYMNGHIRYWLNGEIILEAWDDNPLKMDPSLWIGVRSYDTLMVIESIVISKGTPL